LRAAEQDCYELSRIYAAYNSTRKSEGFQQVGELKEDDTQHRGHFGNGWSPAD
jgi:hypothetical protein